SFIGYEAQTIAIAGKTSFRVSLKEDTQSIDDVVIIAFGTAKKEAFTGSATVVKADDIAKSQNSNVAQSLAGKVAGLQMTNESGAPGSAPTIRIRGFSSVNAGKDPLYIVDGAPYSGDLNNLNSNDIESMTVLKDAASNALYGARGANGVIMITTKKARSHDAVISVDAKWGVNSRALQAYPYITDPGQYYENHYKSLYNYYTNAQGLSAAAAHDLANANVVGSPNDGGLGYQLFTVPEGQYFIGANGKMNPNATMGNVISYKGQDYLLTADDWDAEAYRKSLRQEYNVSISGATDRSSFYGSFGYLNDKGITANSDMYRYTARLKADFQAKKWLKVGGNIGYANFNYNSLNDIGQSNSTGNVFAFTTSIAPVYPVYVRNGKGEIMHNEAGITMYDHGDGMNAGLQRGTLAGSNALSSSRLNTNNAAGNAFNATGFVDITFLKDFKLTINAGTMLDETRSTTVQNPYFGQFAGENGIVGKQHSRSISYNLQQILTYNKTIAEDHHLDVMIGHEYYNDKYYVLYASKSNMFSQSNTELNGAIIDKQGASSYTTEYNNEGYFGRVQYDYRSKYFFSGSYRRDASSRFHPDHRWGNFWSVGAAWIISKENFMTGSQGWLDMLKIKASIGSQGNDNIGNFRYMDMYSIQNSNGQIGVVFDTKGNENITWETNTNFNAGFEFSMFQSRLTGSIDYFYRKTADMLFPFPVAPSMGYSSYYANVGDMVNKGLEIELNATPIRTKHVQWDINLNMTHLRNKISKLPEERKTKEIEGYRGYVSGNTFYGEDVALYTFYMKKFAGVAEDGQALYYKDTKDKDGNITGQETTVKYNDATEYLCGNPIPDLYGGFGTSVSFYGFDVSFNFNYQIGGKAYDSGYAASMRSPSTGDVGSNWHKDMLNAWTPETPSTTIPRLQYGDKYTAATSDRFLTDASYLNLQNINVGYTLPKHITRKFGVDRLRIYLACENVFYWSKRQGFDPRYSFTGSSNQATYSPIRTISGGINIQF
ncbi:MAG: SusC/RagA family TonB-linked outer membrane protein, partial [Alistipes sp.]